MTLFHLLGAFMFFFVFNAVVLGAFLLVLRWIHGRELEFGHAAVLDTAKK